MNLTLAYLGRSGLREGPGGAAIALAPNLAREPVAFDAPLLHPLRFREAVSALHDVVISDLRYKPRDTSAYEAWKKEEARRLAAVRGEAFRQAKAEILSRRQDPVSPGLETDYRRCLKRYWTVRQRYADYLRKHDLDLWRLLMPCDPVVTVADDVVFFECFSADESSYGCLTVDRDGGFGPASGVRAGTTNVDYSWALYDRFQALRTYRETRLRVDPEGFEVATQERPDYREEKIDLPSGWLRGFLQVQAAMGFPMRRVDLPREAVYSVLAWLRRRKARASPRALRFELLPGKPPTLVLEPWGEAVVTRGPAYQGPPGEPIRLWGRQRLLALARLLPLADRVEVYLLGTGLPSFWIVRMGEMRFTLGLSGWTANDWTRGSALDLLAPPADPPATLVDLVGAAARGLKRSLFAELEAESGAGPAQTAAALNRLAHAGQLIYDLGAGVYRWRPILPQAAGEAELGPENPERAAAREIAARRRARVESRQEAPRKASLVAGVADGKPVELLVDADGRIRRGRCVCSHHYRYGIRAGPCRHLLALRDAATGAGAGGAPETNAAWYDRLNRWVTG
jgi:hypothetical protein